MTLFPILKQPMMSVVCKVAMSAPSWTLKNPYWNQVREGGGGRVLGTWWKRKNTQLFCYWGVEWHVSFSPTHEGPSFHLIHIGLGCKGWRKQQKRENKSAKHFELKRVSSQLSFSATRQGRSRKHGQPSPRRRCCNVVVF